MTDLDARFDQLKDDLARNAPNASPSTEELRKRAAQRAQRRRRVVGGAALVSLATITLALIVWARPDETDTDVTVGPPPSVAPAANQRTLGDVSGVTLSASPNTGLHDGDLVEVTVQGLEQLPSAAIVMCAGDVTAQNAMNACDFEAVTDPDASQPGQTRAAPQQRVAVPRFIDITLRSTDPNYSQPYDCATEPAGCVLAVGPIAFPVRGVATPLQFVDDQIPVAAIQVSPATGLTDGQQIDVTGEGLQPNAAVPVQLCRAEPLTNEEGNQSPLCDGGSLATTDAQGHTRVSVRAWATLITWQGLIDCTVEACVAAFIDDSSRVKASAALTFSEAAPEPKLAMSPTGPYVDQQEVTITGSGFRPGLDIGGDIGQCPNDKDTRVEERCGRPWIAPLVVGDDGTFTVRINLYESLWTAGSCKTGAGCHLGWVINHGPTVAKVPLTFR